ncbi:TPA: hypothetical protein DIV48_01215 [Candidatus Kaiserbacteria bacterium]|nr:MAG: 3-oxoacyl-(Acyl-carrier-protein) reductase [Parcubacteria group bacterium GW2011_GWA1_56_13]KKW46324.1 MAG: 3-oxoacyl-(Acyl-carrier-protein) reductase [Parcubacteria group bacterium GW2011_GWB1_57_6]HCR52251.1 hypothetical protein [Candidatus Kaiserbacteria bacterium]
MIQAEDRKFVSLRIGEIASFERTIRADDVRAFADLSGDYSPLHMDDDYARSTQFGDRLVHGMFLGSLVSRLVGMHMPGKHALLMKESLEFKKPVRIGDTVRIEGEIMIASPSTHIIELDIRLYAENMLVATGRVHVQVRDE